MYPPMATKVRTLTARLGQVGENKLMLMAALLIADEFEETRTELQGIKDGKIPVNESETAAKLAELLDGMAETIEVCSLVYGDHSEKTGIPAQVSMT